MRNGRKITTTSTSHQHRTLRHHHHQDERRDYGYSCTVCLFLNSHCRPYVQFRWGSAHVICSCKPQWFVWLGLASRRPDLVVVFADRSFHCTDSLLWLWLDPLFSLSAEEFFEVSPCRAPTNCIRAAQPCPHLPDLSTSTRSLAESRWGNGEWICSFGIGLIRFRGSFLRTTTRGSHARLFDKTRRKWAHHHRKY